jgi:hypothetical protein
VAGSEVGLLRRVETALSIKEVGEQLAARRRACLPTRRRYKPTRPSVRCGLAANRRNAWAMFR